MAMALRFQRMFVGNIRFVRWRCPRTSSRRHGSAIELYRFPENRRGEWMRDTRASGWKHFTHFETQFARILGIKVVESPAAWTRWTRRHRCFGRRAHRRWQRWCWNSKQWRDMCMAALNRLGYILRASIKYFVFFMEDLVLFDYKCAAQYAELS